MTKPAKQKDRQIGFVLFDRRENQIKGEAALVIRPEELTRIYPSRTTEHQTFNVQAVTGARVTVGG